MISKSRWLKAQVYEESFWSGVADDISRDYLGRIDFYEWRANQFRNRMARLGFGHLIEEESRLLEIGSGPVGIIGHLPGSKRVSVDPLNRYYSCNTNLTRFRPEGVHYSDASGEELPLEDGQTDLVIMENCIDHTLNPTKVLSEINRVLRDHGVLYLTVNCRSRIGYYMHRLLARLSLDPGHPHTFTRSRFLNTLQSSGFETVESDQSSWWASWRGDVLGDNWKRRMKGMLLVSEHLLTVVATKKAPDSEGKG